MLSPATPPASSAQAHLGTRDPSSNITREYMLQSRETGEVVPPPSGKPFQDANSRPKPKPFAHFLAGGYVNPRMTTTSWFPYH